MATRERQKLEYSPFDAKLISHKHFEVERLKSLKDDIVRLQIINLELEEYNFPPESEISVMVKLGSENLRTIDLGTVGKTSLKAFDVEFEKLTGQLTCRLNITNPGETPFIGISNWRHPIHANNEGILVTRDEDLGDMMWHFELPSNDFAKPTLVYNRSIPGLIDHIFEDVMLFASIIPTCIKLGIEHIVFSAFDSIEIDGSWQNLWWQFAADRMEDAHEILETDDIDDKHAWCLEFVKRVCEEQQYKDLVLDYLKIEDE